MFCVNCGTSLKENWKFCLNCGHKVESVVEDGFFEVKKEMETEYRILDSQEFPTLFDEPVNEVVYPCLDNFNKYFKVVQKKYSKYDSMSRKIEVLVNPDEDIEYSVEDKLYNSFDIIEKETGKVFNALAGLRAYKIVENGLYFIRNDVFYFLSIEGEQKTIDLVENVISMIYNSVRDTFDFIVYKGNTQIAWHECRESCGGNFENYYDVYSIQTGIKTVKNIYY